MTWKSKSNDFIEIKETFSHANWLTKNAYSFIWIEDAFSLKMCLASDIFLSLDNSLFEIHLHLIFLNA